MKLTGEAIQTAWEKYDLFVQAMKEMDPKLEVSIEQAFKMGFIEGHSSGTSLIRVPIKRNYTVKRVYRSSTEMKQQEQIISEFLKVQGRTTPLAAIIKHANRCGFYWTSKNASGFMLKIMEVNRHIKKVERGFYMYSRRERV